MADRMLEEEPEPLMAKARETLAVLIAEDQRRIARRRAARVFAKLQEVQRSATVNILGQSVDTSRAGEQVSQ
jgi:hypothetical protein